MRSEINIPAILFGRKKIDPKDFKKALRIRGSPISKTVALFISVESKPEYFKDAK